jgi:amicyanin
MSSQNNDLDPQGFEDAPHGFVRGGRALFALLAAGLVAAIGGIAAAASGGAEIMIDNFRFSPIPQTVTTGSTVTWLNRDDIPHSIVVPELGVHSHPMDTNEIFSYRFDRPGTYDYICGIHPFMRGKIVVQN